MRCFHKIRCLIFLAVFALSQQALSASCDPEPIDLPLESSTQQNQSDLQLITQRLQGRLYSPSQSQLNAAINTYNTANIQVSNGSISGVRVSNFYAFNRFSFLRAFAQQLVNNPNDQATIEKLNNFVWLVGQQFCDGTLKDTSAGYQARYFLRAVSPVLSRFLSGKAADLYEVLATRSLGSAYRLVYFSDDNTFAANNGFLNTDRISNVSDSLLGLFQLQSASDLKHQQMRLFQRYMNRFAQYSPGSSDGLKADGSGFHHWAAFNHYMYAYQTYINNLWTLRGTSYQISRDGYFNFRDAVYYQYMQATSTGLTPLSLTGRNPSKRDMVLNASHLKTLAHVGGAFFDESDYDPVLAQLYNRIYGVHVDFANESADVFDDGFIQYNHANAGGFRKNGALVFAKGFNNALWGSEYYATANRFGRYQSYGTLEVLYPTTSADKMKNHGYNAESWNWNYSPGATTIALPWHKLESESEGVDEIQQKRFAGALAFNRTNKQNLPLKQTSGEFGIFAMDFQEARWSGRYGQTYRASTHNPTFKFKKSVFFFDDFIVNLGSGIQNDDHVNTTVTTLFQKLDNQSGVLVNNQEVPINNVSSFSGQHNWVLANNNDERHDYRTGYLLVSNSSLKVKHSYQQTPNANQNQYLSNGLNYSQNPRHPYYLTFLDHGRSPSSQGYEYLVKTFADAEKMQALADKVKSNKPYTVHQKNDAAHVVHHHASDIWGYAIFDASALNLSYSHVKTVDTPSMIMHQYNAASETLKLAITDPRLDFSRRSYSPAHTHRTINVTLKGAWAITHHDNAEVISVQNNETLIRFIVKDALPNEVQLRAVEDPTAYNSLTAINDSKVKISEYDTVKGQLIVNNNEVLAQAKFSTGPWSAMRWRWTNFLAREINRLNLDYLKAGVFNSETYSFETLFSSYRNHVWIDKSFQQQFASTEFIYFKDATSSPLANALRTAQNPSMRSIGDIMSYHYNVELGDTVVAQVFVDSELIAEAGYTPPNLHKTAGWRWTDHLADAINDLGINGLKAGELHHGRYETISSNYRNKVWIDANKIGNKNMRLLVFKRKN